MSTKTFYKPEKSIELDSEIRFNPDLSWGEKVYFSELKSLCKKGKCPYHQTHLANLLNVSIVSIHNWTKKLCGMGLIEVIMDDKNPDYRMSIKIKNKTVECVK